MDSPPNAGSNVAQPQPAAARRILPAEGLLLVLAAVTIFSLGFFPIRDGGDQWWHLKTGKYLLDVKFNFPEEDVFSWTSKGHPWANHEWLADTLMYLGYEAFGLKGLIALKALVLMGAFLLVAGLIWRRTGSTLWAAAGMAAAGWASQYSMHLRPPVITYFMMAAYLHLLFNLRKGKWTTATQIASFPFMALWINLHGGAILGLVLTGLHFAPTLAVAMLHRFKPSLCNTGEDAPALARRYGLHLAIVLAASLCNPFTYHIHLLTLKVMGNKELLRFVSELQPPDFRFTTGYNLLLALLAISVLLSIRRFRFSIAMAADCLMALFFLHQSIHHVRHLPLFSIAAAPMVFQLLAGWQRNLTQGSSLRVKQAARGVLMGIALATALGCLGLTGFRWQNFMRFMFTGPGYVRAGIPIEAAEFIKRHPFQGRMYNPINFSGYLIWALSPEYHQTFTDSRFDIFGSEVMIDCLAIEAANVLDPNDYGLPREQQEEIQKKIETGQALPYWRQALDRYDIQFMILGADSRLHETLSAHPDQGWALVYQDPGYAIHVRESEENRALIQSAREMYETIRAAQSKGQ